VSDAVSTLSTADRIRSAGLRATGPRVAVLDALYAVPHADVEAVLTQVRARSEVSTQAVYDVLRAFTDAGLVRRIEPAGSPARFETRVGDNHHHVVCRTCGATADVDCAVGAAPCLDPSNDAGFTIDESEVTHWGLCPDCQPTTRGEREPRA
jgi:Fur family ferric uptake transcriptional regulator